MNKKKKILPELRFPEFDKDGEWILSTIGELGDFYYGKSAPKWSLSEDAPTPCVRYGELYTKFGTVIREIFSRTNIEPSNLRFSKGGEVLIPRVGEDPYGFANCSYLPFPNIAIGEMISVYETEEDSIFYAYYFSTLKTQFAKVVEGQNVKNLYYVNLEPIAVGRPLELAEQQKIAACLSSLDELITAHSDKLEILKDYKKGLMQNLFPQEGQKVPNCRFQEFEKSGKWMEKTIEDICEVNPSVGELPDEFVYVDLESVSNGLLLKKNIIKKKGAPSRAKRLLEDKDVIFQMVRPYQKNNYYFIGSDDFNYVASTGYAQLKAFDSSRFLFQLIHTDRFVSSVLKKCTGSNYPAINSSALKRIEVQIPPSAGEQRKIAFCLTAVDELITAQSRKINQLQKHKKGLMQGLFPKIKR